MAESHGKNHEYHILGPSPWPLISSLGAFIIAIGGVAYMRYLRQEPFNIGGGDFATPLVFYLGLAITVYAMFGWWADTIKEAHQGNHTRVVSLHLRYGMIIFIISELMFFVAWFWAFFDSSLFPDEALQAARAEYTGGKWPPVGIKVLDPYHFPLFNTAVLLLSGTTITWAHHALIHDQRDMLKRMLFFTIALGLLFTFVQGYEYFYAPFSFRQSIYGSTFLMATGFHGFHVVVGTIFLVVCLFRTMAGHFTPKQHFGFEAAAWYWHFVDVVWLFLFFSIYIWGSWGATVAHID